MMERVLERDVREYPSTLSLFSFGFLSAVAQNGKKMERLD